MSFQPRPTLHNTTDVDELLIEISELYKFLKHGCYSIYRTRFRRAILITVYGIKTAYLYRGTKTNGSEGVVKPVGRRVQAHPDLLGHRRRQIVGGGGAERGPPPQPPRGDNDDRRAGSGKFLCKSLLVGGCLLVDLAEVTQVAKVEDCAERSGRQADETNVFPPVINPLP